MILNKIVNLFNRFSNWKTLVLFFGLYVFFNAYVLPKSESKINSLSNKEVGVVDLTFGYNPERTIEMTSNYSAEAKDYYINTELFTDTIYVLVYVFFFAILLTLLLKKSSLKRVSLLPFVIMIFDFLENYFIITLLKMPIPSYNQAVFCEIFKLGKWITFAVVLLLVLYGVILKLKPKRT